MKDGYHLEGSYNNFLQFWKENTEEVLHREQVKSPHPNIHLAIKKKGVDNYILTTSEGRDENNKIAEHLLTKNGDNFFMDGAELIYDPESFSLKSEHGEIIISNDAIHWKGYSLSDFDCTDYYILKKSRLFSGWIQYPPDIEKPDDLIDLRDLNIHDQGGIVEFNHESTYYTVELVQLVYAHSIEIMKLAIYDCPTSALTIHRKAISYTWVNPSASRIGLNLRNIITGWTLKEPGYINSNNLNKT